MSCIILTVQKLVRGNPRVVPRRLAQSLESLAVPGVHFVPLYFTPSASVHQGAQCGGVNLIPTDISRFRSVATGLALIQALYRLYPEKFEIDKVLRLLGNEKALHALKEGQSANAILKGESSTFNNFLDNRRKALIYNVSPAFKEGKK